MVAIGEDVTPPDAAAADRLIAGLRGFGESVLSLLNPDPGWPARGRQHPH
jgi:hypothetical protein